MEKVVRLGSINEFLDGQFRQFELSLLDVLVGRIGSQWYAWNAQCPHGAFNIGRGLTKSGKAVCPGHGLTFDLINGNCIEEKYLRLTAYKIETRGKDVFIDLSGDMSL